MIVVFFHQEFVLTAHSNSKEKRMEHTVKLPNGFDETILKQPEFLSVLISCVKGCICIFMSGIYIYTVG